MSEPWVTIIGLNEDGLDGLSAASRAALEQAEFVFGGARHLELAGVGAKGQPWPIPFSTAPVPALRGRKVAVLASGDPFWFGAGGSLMADLGPGEWVSHPAPSSFQLACNALGWRMEEVRCLALHAADFQSERAKFQRGARLILTLRDGDAPVALAHWLESMGWGDSVAFVLSRLGGPHQTINKGPARAMSFAQAPVMVALEIAGAVGLPRTPGLPDDGFVTDGVMTKSHIRALTLAALAPRPGEVLWDLGAGSGTISVEWCLAGGIAHAVEPKETRQDFIRLNRTAYGIEKRLTLHSGKALDVLAALPHPDAVFIGGGASEALLSALWSQLPPGTRLVANAVTLETESLLTLWHGQKGGNLYRFQVSQADSLGTMRGWQAERPVTQWVVTR
ncbi:precorrin-6y C5,15-methyltransferase (decarboxylating) subunit CbiE [Neogemmobacter tilapiae]|uniref:Precorrin-6Y methyltransferase n=1 Tax=Neogemmobacter tilapiae TaxID=875041 RepID=A0A918TTB0_9RHOB|nr:precorrin-6y C5,15-methyltransferase (decarboxylating) subunit CbiE [Gemmobacter tilapiae]GHC62594.1 precorrin-6Y methyltransferase [Gemmobacter tilapiae]